MRATSNEGPDARVAFARRQAQAEGLLDDKGAPRTLRIPPRLLEAARRRLGLERPTDVVTAALAHIVYDDRFGEHLLALKGQASPDFMAGLDADAGA